MLWNDSFICFDIYGITHSYVTWLIHVCSDMTCFLWHDSFMCDMTYAYVTWLVQMRRDVFIRKNPHSYHTWQTSFICDTTRSKSDMIFSYVTCLVHVWHDVCICDMLHFICDMSHMNGSHMGHDSFIWYMTHSYVAIYMTLLIHTWHDSSMCDMTHLYMITHLYVLYVTWLVRLCDVTHSYVWHASFICVIWHACATCVTWLIHVSCVWHGVTWLVRKCNMVYSYVWHDSPMTWLLCTWHNSFICPTRDLTRSFWVMWLVHTCGMTHPHVWHDVHEWLDSSTRDVTHLCVLHVTRSCVWRDPFVCVAWLIHMCDMTHPCVTCVITLIHMSCLWHD